MISIVTPSLNQAKYLDQTILSIIQQQNCEFEYVIMDGGSTDNSVEIIKSHQEKIFYWESKCDQGQADAIYRGFERTSGDILGWVNSDDFLLPGALNAVSNWFNVHRKEDLLIGNCLIVDENGKKISEIYTYPITYESLLFYGGGFYQPATFWRREAFFSVGGFDRALKFSFDYDLYLRITRRKKAGKINRFLAAFRNHPESKTNTLQEIRCLEDKILWMRNYRNRYPAWYCSRMKSYYKLKANLYHKYHKLLNRVTIKSNI
jgi:glycosyltransferase involved in cell wall biosynthesis